MPTAAALDPDRLTAVSDRMRQDVDAGLLPSCSAAVAIDGQVAWTATFGDATDDSRYVMFSCTKALIAGVMWQLIGEDRIQPETRVAEVFDEFGANGKDQITVEQVMTHTSGFPRAPLGPPRWNDRFTRIETMAMWRLNWEPGTAFEYHPTSAHWVLAELIERLDERDYRESVRARILEPLGLTRLALGVPAEQQGDIVELVMFGDEPSADELRSVLGIDTFDRGEVTPEVLLAFNETSVRAIGVPGGGGVSTASDLAMLYQAFLHNTGDLWDPEVLADGIGHVRVTMKDPMLGVPSARTLGLTSAGTDGLSAFRGMGHNVSSRAFGHNGAAGQIAWADPESGISFVYFTNGVDRNFLREARRTNGIASRAGLVTTPPT